MIVWRRGPWALRVAFGVLLAGLLAACSPTEGTPSEPGSSPTAPDSASSDPSPGVVVTGSVDPLPDELFPAVVDGYRFDRGLGVPRYDAGEDTVTDRISISEELFTTSSHDWFEGINNDHQELRPGVWCYTADSFDLCSVNGTTGRLWVTEVLIGDMTMEELAQWTQEFAGMIP